MCAELKNVNKSDGRTKVFNSRPIFCSEFTMTKEIFYDFSSVSYSIPLIFFIIIFALSVLYFIVQLFEGKYSSLAMQEALPFAFSVFYFAFTKYSVNKNYKRYMLSVGTDSSAKEKICFSDKISASRGNRSPVEYDYGSVSAVYETKKLFLLRMKYSLYLLVSKDSFPGETKNAFINFLFSSCANIKKKKVKNVCGREKLCILFMLLTAAVFLTSLALYIINIYIPLPSLV